MCTDATAIDACPFLEADQPSSALCIPFNVTGQAVGVLHSPGAIGAAPEAKHIEDLERLVSQTGARVGMLRVMERTPCRPSATR